MSHHKVLPWAGWGSVEGRPREALPKGPGWAQLPPSVVSPPEYPLPQWGTLKMSTSCPGEPEAEIAAIGCFRTLIGGQVLRWSSGPGSATTCLQPGLGPRSKPLQDSVSSSVLWKRTQDARPVCILGISDRQPSTPVMGQVPFSIYWSFLDGAAKDHSALQKEVEPADPGSIATTKQLPPKDRSDNGSAGEEAAHCHSEGPANHLIQYSKLSPPQQPQKLLIK